MQIETLDLIEGAKQARGLAVIIDVFRAFSTACYVVRNGAEEIIPVGDVELAYQLKEENPGCVLMGERKGQKLPGFDYGNSPTEIETVGFSGKSSSLKDIDSCWANQNDRSLIFTFSTRSPAVFAARNDSFKVSNISEFMLSKNFLANFPSPRRLWPISRGNTLI